MFCREWEDFGLESALINKLKQCHYLKPRKVQSIAIPLIGKGYNVLCQAENAAGKTMAFVVPVIDALCKSIMQGQYRRNSVPTPFAVIISPTRELV